MKKAEVVVGREYLAKVSGTLQRVRVTRCVVKSSRIWSGYSPNPRYRETTRWEGLNLKTGRAIVIKSAQRLRPLYPRCEGYDPAFSEPLRSPPFPSDYPTG